MKTVVKDRAITQGNVGDHLSSVNNARTSLLTQLAEGLELIYLSHARGVELATALLDHVDNLLREIEIYRTHAGNTGTGHC